MLTRLTLNQWAMKNAQKLGFVVARQEHEWSRLSFAGVEMTLDDDNDIMIKVDKEPTVTPSAAQTLIDLYQGSGEFNGIPVTMTYMVVGGRKV